jgi:hypothetical protein
MHSYHHTQSLVVMGFTSFEMPCVTAHCFTWVWVVHATKGCTVGYIASSRLCFISALLVGWLGEPRGLYPACAKYCYKAKMEPCSSVHSLSYHGNCHPVRKVNCGIPCVCTIGLRGFH